MKSKIQLNINFFGEFSIKNESSYFPKEVKKSNQLIILIANLILFRDEAIPKTKLIDIMWPNNTSDNLEGALRNLIYRARKEMIAFFPGEDIDCILSKGNTYVWNNEIICNIDIVGMEELCKKIESEKDIQLVYKQSTKLLKKYSGSFLDGFEEDWILHKKAYYEDKLAQTIDIAASKLLEKEEYDDVIKLCDNMDIHRLLNSQLHEKKLYSYYKLNKISQALSYYHKVMDLYYEHFGVKVSQGIQDIYQQLIDEEAHTPLTVKELVASLDSQAKENGSFYCDFDLFQNVYKIYSRDAKRNSNASYIVLLTMSDDSNTEKEVEMERYSEKLKQIIIRKLRKNDVFSRCSLLNYTLILSCENEKGCETALQRILECFYKKTKKDTLSLTYDIEKIK